MFTAIARAEPGGVAVHCGIGRDRTGLITILLLALAGADADEIAADYALSEARVPFGQVGTFYEDRGLTPAGVIAELLDGLDVEGYLRGAGVSEEDLAAIRSRLVSAAGRPSRPGAGTPRPAT